MTWDGLIQLTGKFQVFHSSNGIPGFQTGIFHRIPFGYENFGENNVRRQDLDYAVT